VSCKKATESCEKKLYRFEACKDRFDLANVGIFHESRFKGRSKRYHYKYYGFFITKYYGFGI
jgi:hypothetical protein